MQEVETPQLMKMKAVCLFGVSRHINLVIQLHFLKCFKLFEEHLVTA